VLISCGEEKHIQNTRQKAGFKGNQTSFLKQAG
jgi:hypothetical protein